eukprot:CAMPEP_0201570954 /NCGR_PEP_ID=MMETSP0190_2-20130828/13452_1 /ASSEMBLY_ACC=CAM_ASM_000263 /TAXON_ID=37353 /ORGANISM="Rosalina sp." /LENGTH=261 /DNA_ID=CAMNT_0047995059 /DNA_START=8 /DNA_END=790 /DNA_ORIENTATION=-
MDSTADVTIVTGSPSITPNTSTDAFEVVPSSSVESVISIPSNTKPNTKSHSCSSYKFYNNLPSSIQNQLHTDILNLIFKYYSPKQSSTSTIEHEIASSISSNKLRHTNIPLPSWGLSETDYRKRFPTKCPHLSTHLTLECLVWIMVMVCLIMGGGNIGSVIVLLIFYLIIQALLYCIGYCYVHGLHRYKSIMSAPLYDKTERISYFHDKFDKSPLISLNLMMYESMISINPMIIEKELSITECATMITDEDDDGCNGWDSW